MMCTEKFQCGCHTAITMLYCKYGLHEMFIARKHMIIIIPGIGKSYDCSCIVATCTVDHVDRRIYVPIHSLPVMWRFGGSDRSSSPFLRIK